MLLQPAFASLLCDNSILQEIQADGSLYVLADNMEATDAELDPDTLIESVQEVTATPCDNDSDTSPPPEATTHAEFDTLPTPPSEPGCGQVFQGHETKTDVGAHLGLPSIPREAIHPGH